jgi:C4-dicarboxylate transporter, DctM subunit
MIILAIIIALLVVLASGIPVAIGLGIVGLGAAWLMDGSSALMTMPQTIYASTNSFLLTAVPLFILMSEILRRAGVTEILFETVTKWLGHLPGGLGVSTVVTSAIGASITGSSVANAASMAIVAAPPMIDRGYDRKFTYGLIAASGTLGILIPPSIPMLLFAAITDESVGKLFAAGMVPGVLLALLLCGYVIVSALTGRSGAPLAKASWTDRMAQTRKAAFALVLPPIVIGGIYFGFFTATEAAGVGVLYALFISLVVYRTLRMSDLLSILIDSLQATCMILLLIAGSMVLGHVVTTLQVSQDLMALIQGYDLPAWAFILAVMVMLFILGCILEVISVIYIVVPILYPVLITLGIDPIWFAVLFIVNMEIALITPPVGMVLYVITGIVQRPVSEVIAGALPFVGLLFVFLFLLILVPSLTMTLPTLIN